MRGQQLELESPENWAIHCTHHRDSGLLDQSNAEVIARKLETFMKGDDPDMVAESHEHWLVGHIDGFSIGSMTPAGRSPTPSIDISQMTEACRSRNAQAIG